MSRFEIDPPATSFPEARKYVARHVRPLPNVKVQRISVRPIAVFVILLLKSFARMISLLPGPEPTCMYLDWVLVMRMRAGPVCADEAHALMPAAARPAATSRTIVLC